MTTKTTWLLRPELRAAAVSLAVLLSACSDRTGPDSPATNATAQAPAVQPAPPAVLPRPTAQDWQAAVALAIPVPESAADINDKGNGVSSFMTCMLRISPTRCDLVANIDRDAFRKLRHVQPVINTALIDQYGTSVKTYVSLPDNGMPVFFLSASYVGRGSWLFMNRVAIMAGGEIAFEQALEHNEVDRDNTGSVVAEQTQIIVDGPKLDALRKIATAKDVLVRLTGEKSFAAVPNAEVVAMQKSMIDALRAHDLLTAALKDKIP